MSKRLLLLASIPFYPVTAFLLLVALRAANIYFLNVGKFLGAQVRALLAFFLGAMILQKVAIIDGRPLDRTDAIIVGYFVGLLVAAISVADYFQETKFTP